MKVIVSHDVDHLYPSDHWRDLYYPKMWVRSFLELVRGQIRFSVFWHRLISVFDQRINRLPEICAFDKEYGVRSTFFFGMEHALGMSYNQDKALPWIRFVKEQGYDAGVHGCDYLTQEGICKEHDDFAQLTGSNAFGIRNHYVRYDEDTFRKMAQAGYVFDTSEFNKEKPTYKAPYRVGRMWEFPLAIMDGYVLRHDLQKAQQTVMDLFRDTAQANGQYVTILFHDCFYNEKCFPVEKAFYEWIIKYVQSLHLEFISYQDAIKELEHGR